jgi:hypothetical protein
VTPRPCRTTAMPTGHPQRGRHPRGRRPPRTLAAMAPSARPSPVRRLVWRLAPRVGSSACARLPCCWWCRDATPRTPTSPYASARQRWGAQQCACRPGREAPWPPLPLPAQAEATRVAHPLSHREVCFILGPPARRVGRCWQRRTRTDPGASPAPRRQSAWWWGLSAVAAESSPCARRRSCVAETGCRAMP